MSPLRGFSSTLGNATERAATVSSSRVLPVMEGDTSTLKKKMRAADKQIIGVGNKVPQTHNTREGNKSKQKEA